MKQMNHPASRSAANALLVTGLLAAVSCVRPMEELATDDADAGAVVRDAGRQDGGGSLYGQKRSPPCVDAGPQPTIWNRVDAGSTVSGSLSFPLRFVGFVQGSFGKAPSGPADMSRIAIVFSSEDQSSSCTEAGNLHLLTPDFGGGQVVLTVGSTDGGDVRAATYGLPPDGGEFEAFGFIGTSILNPSGERHGIFKGGSEGTVQVTAITAESVTGTFQLSFPPDLIATAYDEDSGVVSGYVWDGGTVSGVFVAPFCTRCIGCSGRGIDASTACVDGQ